MQKQVTATVKNERLKLLANFSNIIASAIFATGSFGPLVTYLYSKLFDSTPAYLILSGASVCLLTALGLHSFGQWILGGLEEP
jgi:hypothetical protein